MTTTMPAMTCATTEKIKMAATHFFGFSVFATTKFSNILVYLLGTLMEPEAYCFFAASVASL